MTSLAPVSAPREYTAAEIAAAERRLKKAHVDMLRHKATCGFSGVILRGVNKVVTDGSVPTACCDGKNKSYGIEFLEKQTQPELVGLVCHENLHDAWMHMYRDRDLRKESHRLYNAAADYVINADIVELHKQYPMFIKLPEGGLYDAKFVGWSARQVYMYFRDQCESVPQPGQPGQGQPQPGQGQPQSGQGEPHAGADKVRDKQTGEVFPIGGGFDEHDYQPGDGMTPDELGKEAKDIKEALQQGGTVAGVRGGNLPRALEESLIPKVDWREVLRDFVMEVCVGRDSSTWRSANRKFMPMGVMLPSTESEVVGELVLAIDTSGSISQSDLSAIAAEVSKLCDETQPDKVRVLWWDTKVHGEQVFEPDVYANIAHMLKPKGGGGTRVSSVSEYLSRHQRKTAAVIVFTDGYVEGDIQWQVNAPTLWVLPESGCNKRFAPPTGKVVSM
jgi:predicted metal-dependent peptidase